MRLFFHVITLQACSSGNDARKGYCPRSLLNLRNATIAQFGVTQASKKRCFRCLAIIEIFMRDGYLECENLKKCDRWSTKFSMLNTSSNIEQLISCWICSEVLRFRMSVNCMKWQRIHIFENNLLPKNGSMT